MAKGGKLNKQDCSSILPWKLNQRNFVLKVYNNVTYHLIIKMKFGPEWSQLLVIGYLAWHSFSYLHVEIPCPGRKYWQTLPFWHWCYVGQLSSHVAPVVSLHLVSLWHQIANTVFVFDLILLVKVIVFIFATLLGCEWVTDISI